MKKIISIGLLSLLVVSCSVTKNSNSKTVSSKTKNPSLQKLDVQSYINSISLEDLKANLTIIASDKMQGRDTVSYTHLDVYKRQEVNTKNVGLFKL